MSEASNTAKPGSVTDYISLLWISFEDYMKLPVSQFGEEKCPNCGAPHFGSYQADRHDINRVYVCHGNELTGVPSCGTKFRPPEPDYDGVCYSLGWKASKVFGAFIREMAA